ncbi:hypothetical protein H0H81_003373 [Sphagnurus paluster]|uniref:ubiquitinyl hydrolase 1 n=1 Tax=Sphagnurus paluster TaxID=117069 RepID=A0A9P7FYU5_9AGAR|nr:hypothetical protein H0H81_003373 [Sphagnurus paluster]
MAYSRDSSTLITGSWDRTLRFWDSRANSPQQSSHDTPERVYHLDLVNHTLVVAMASRLFHIYDIRKMDTPAQQRESSLKFMTRSLACMPDGQGYATASVEGRIAVEYFDPSPAAQEKKYAFKCHRQTIDDVDHVWPVNALAFHPIYNTFASAGSDATVSIWDHKVKKRLRQYPKFPNPISSLAFNCGGTKLAVAVSYTWDEGEAGLKTAERPMVLVKKLGDEIKWSSKAGLVTARAQFEDVYGLDAELLDMVKKPVKAVLLLFPITEAQETKRKEEDLKIDETGQPWLDPTIIWIKQTTPDERARHLETTPLFANIHAEAASGGQSEVPADLETDLHFTCFVRAPAVRGSDSPGGYRVVELDGRRQGPVDRGECTDLLKDVANVIKEKYLSNTSSMYFNMIALGPGPQA